jgi:hypothetical protein
MAMTVRYALTLSQPILLLADVKKMELMVQRREVNKAALSPTTAESILFTVSGMSLTLVLELHARDFDQRFT